MTRSAEISALLEAQRYGVLSTCQSNAPTGWKNSDNAHLRGILDGLFETLLSIPSVLRRWSLLSRPTSPRSCASRNVFQTDRCSNGHPYASLVAFSASEDLTQIVFCTLKATRKFKNLASDERVAFLVDSRSNREADLQQSAAVTVLGTCDEAIGDDRTQLSDRFLARHPAMTEFVTSPNCAVMRVNVRSYYLVTRFQNVVELHI